MLPQQSNTFPEIISPARTSLKRFRYYLLIFCGVFCRATALSVSLVECYLVILVLEYPAPTADLLEYIEVNGLTAGGKGFQE